MCDSLIRGSSADLRAVLPGLRIDQVIHVLGEESVTEASPLRNAASTRLWSPGRSSVLALAPGFSTTSSS